MSSPREGASFVRGYEALARNSKVARESISHGHTESADRRIHTNPTYIATAPGEAAAVIAFAQYSLASMSGSIGA